MHYRTSGRRRRGVTTLETGIVLLAFLTLILGMLDLGICVLHYHTLGEAARQGARQAMVHGSLATQLGSWSGDNYQTPLKQALKPYLVGMDPDKVTITATWIDGGNSPGQRVSVQLTTSYKPIITTIFPGGAINLKATSTMPIAH